MMGDTKFRQTGRRTAQGPYREDVSRRKYEEGHDRNAAWEALSSAEQIASLRRRRGASMRQLTRLAAKVEV